MASGGIIVLKKKNLTAFQIKVTRLKGPHEELSCLCAPCLRRPQEGTLKTNS